MTNIATKDGAVVVKDGSIGTDCACCGSGWYCYTPSCGECPCNYAAALPSTLSASLSFDISGPLYGAVLGNFSNAFVSTTKLSPSQAASINGVYVLTKSSSSLAQCIYEYRAAGVMGIETFIRIHVGYGGRLGYSYQPLSAGAGYFPCPPDQLSLSLIFFKFGVPVSVREDGYTGPLNTVCNGASYLSHAASYQYNGVSALGFPDEFPNTGWECLGAPIYNRGLNYDWSQNSSEVPSCVSCPINIIDHTWKVGVKYTDTSGAGPVVRTYDKAVTLRVFE